jgi:hypothetical protein
MYLALIKADGYATSSKYVNTCMNCIRQNDLTRFDYEGRKITPSLIEAVIEGAYGNGNARIVALTEDGYNAVEVQRKVNELYKIAKELEPIKQKAGEYFECVLKFL